MKLSFSNPSRSFDASSHRIAFWGYDSAIEVSFYVEADALRRLCPEMNDDELAFLKAFDASVERIHGVADKVYRLGAKGSYAYILAAKEF